MNTTARTITTKTSRKMKATFIGLRRRLARGRYASGEALPDPFRAVWILAEPAAAPPSWAKTAPASCQSRQPSRHTRESGPTRPSAIQVCIMLPLAGPNCPPSDGRTYQTAPGASANGSTLRAEMGGGCAGAAPPEAATWGWSAPLGTPVSLGAFAVANWGGITGSAGRLADRSTAGSPEVSGDGETGCCASARALCPDVGTAGLPLCRGASGTAAARGSKGATCSPRSSLELGRVLSVGIWIPAPQ